MTAPRFAAAALALSLLAGSALAAAPPNPAMVTKNPTAAPAGVYKSDPGHTSVVARVPHGGGMSISIFRFGDTAATLDWNPADASRAKLTATVETASIGHPVKGFPEELAGEGFLSSVKFPTATFTSTQVRPTGPLSADIMGNLSFRGVTRPMTLKATMIGAGKNREGKAALGFSATGMMKPSEFGVGVAGPEGMIELMIDAEFAGA